MKTSKIEAVARLTGRLTEYGIAAAHVPALLKIERTLQRWSEQECGDSNGNAIERDETTGKPYRTWYSVKGDSYRARSPIPDLEAAALKRLAGIMAAYPSLLAYHQGDCRGCAVYILRRSDVKPGESLDSVYNRGVAVCI